MKKKKKKNTGTVIYKYSGIKCVKKKKWLKCKNNNTRNVFKANYYAGRSIFDKMNRQGRRQCQRTEQEKLQNGTTSRDFWNEIGKLSLANERK